MIITESKLLHKFSWLSVWVKAAVRCWEKSFLFYRKKGGWDRKLYQWYISLHCCFNYKVQPLRVCHEAPKTLTQDLWCKKRTALKSKVWNITVPRSKTRPLHSITGKTWYSCPMSSMQTHTSRHTKMTNKSKLTHAVKGPGVILWGNFAGKVRVHIPHKSIQRCNESAPENVLEEWCVQSIQWSAADWFGTHWPCITLRHFMLVFPGMHQPPIGLAYLI